MINKTKIRLNKDITPLQKQITWLRYANKAGDIETVNNTVLGRLKVQQIDFDKLNT